MAGTYNDELSGALTDLCTAIKGANTRAGDLASLSTTAKSSLVAAINELKASISGAGATINDAAPSTSAVYSSQKVTDLVTAATASILNGSPAALDTLKELADALGDDANFSSTVTTALGNRLRFDAAQTLDSTQKAQGNTNLGSVSLAQFGDPAIDLRAVVAAGLA